MSPTRALSRKPAITSWDPEDPGFWETTGRRIASRNMWTSVITEHIGFSVWSLWSVLVLFMSKKTGYSLSPADKFLLASIVTLVGACSRPLYGYAVTRLGGRTWTTISTLFLFGPVIAATVILGHPHAPFGAFIACAAVSGIGGGSFASSTTNINFFFPVREKGRALGINAGAGNLGVASVQLLGLLVIAVAGLTHPRLLVSLFVPLLLIAALVSYRLMDNLPNMRTGGTDFARAMKDPYTLAISLLYIGTFGSFIGYSFAFGLVLQNDFGRTPLQAASLTFIGPLIGSLLRPYGGHLADRFGAARVTLASFAGLAACTAFTIAAYSAHNLPLFIVAFVALFTLSGFGNGATYAMIPLPYAAAAEWEIEAGADPETARAAARRKAGAVITIAGAFGGLGGVGINLAFRESYTMAHTGRPAMIGFLAFYAVCAGITLAARRRAHAAVPARVPVTA